MSGMRRRRSGSSLSHDIGTNKDLHGLIVSCAIQNRSSFLSVRQFPSEGIRKESGLLHDDDGGQEVEGGSEAAYDRAAGAMERGTSD